MQKGTAIVNYLADMKKKTKVGKPSEKFRIHSENIDISAAVEEKISRILPQMEANTVIVYDLSDIAKLRAKKREGLTKIFDRSKRKQWIHLPWGQSLEINRS